MRLEKKQEQELAKRKGLASRTIAQTIWLVLSAVIVYFVVDAIFDNGVLSYEFFYGQLSLPRAVPEWVILGALILVGIIIMQFFLILGFAFASPEARARTGKPTPYSKNPDPLEREYRN